MHPQDFGPIYAETNMDRFPVEPWNTFSNLIFFALIVYFAVRTKLNWSRHPFIVFCLPILAVGFIGGTIYHATRSSSLWLYLDFMPILILALLASIFFLRQLAGSYLKPTLLVILSFICLSIFRRNLDLPLFISIGIGYGFLASLIILPALLVAKKDKWKNVHLIFSCFISFAIALVFRTIDSNIGREISEMGTHFLWHILGGLSVFCLIEFIFRRDLTQASLSE